MPERQPQYDNQTFANGKLVSEKELGFAVAVNRYHYFSDAAAVAVFKRKTCVTQEKRRVTVMESLAGARGRVI